MNKYTNKLVMVVGGLIGTLSIAHAAPGAYVQAQGGVGGMDTKHYSNNNQPFNSVSIREGIAYRLSAGYLLSYNNLDYGAELGYGSYPNNTYKAFQAQGNNAISQVTTYKGSNIDLLGVAKYNFVSGSDNGFYLIGKAGVARVWQKYNSGTSLITLAANSTTTLNSTKTALKPEVALGGGYNFTQNLSVDLTVDHIFGDTTNPAPTVTNNGSNTQFTNAASKIATVNTFMAGLSYHFA